MSNPFSRRKAQLKQTELAGEVKSNPLVFVILITVVGVLVLHFSYAQPNFSSFEPENASFSGDVSIGSDPSASGGKFIIFGDQDYQDVIVSTTGNDLNDGSSPDDAVRTISRAVALADGHTRIRIMAGEYIETIRVQKNDLIIEPYGNGDVSINGAIPEFINGVNWTPVQAGIYKYNLGRDEFYSGGNAIYGSDGQQQWSYADLVQLLSRLTVNNLPGVFMHNFLFNNDVYVASDTGGQPEAPLYIGGIRPTIDLRGVENIRINGQAGSKLKIMYGSINISTNNSENIKIDNVEIIGGQRGINVLNTSDLSITNSKITGTFGRNWDWSDVKERPGSKTMENRAILVKPSAKDVSGITVENNEVSGYFDGIVFHAAGGSFNDNSVISNNVVHNMADDGIEVEAPLRNLIISGNRVYDSHSPFAAAGQSAGPVYIFENLFVAERVDTRSFGASTHGPSYSIKMNNVGPDTAQESMHFYFNTFYFEGGISKARRTVESRSNSIPTNLSFTNNIFYSYDGGILNGTGRLQDNVQWDGNVFYSPIDAPQNYYAWNSFYDPNNSYSNLSSIISSGAMPAQWAGNAEANPRFNCVDSSNTNCFIPSSAITTPSNLQPVPGNYPQSSRLNNRDRLGAY